LQDTEIDGAAILAPDELQGRLAAGCVAIGHVLDPLIERAHAIEPPHHVLASIAARQARVAPDRERHGPARRVDFLRELHARGRSAHHEHAAFGQLLGPAVARGSDLVKLG
jgi:hypothetical protein